MLFFGLMDFDETVLFDGNVQFFPGKTGHQLRLAVAAFSYVPFGHGDRDNAVEMRILIFLTDIMSQKAAQWAGISPFVIKLEIFYGVGDKPVIEKRNIEPLQKGIIRTNAVLFSTGGAKGIGRHPGKLLLALFAVHLVNFHGVTAERAVLWK